MGRYSPMKHQGEGADGPGQEPVGGSSLPTTTLATGHSSLNLSSVVQLRPDPNDGSMVQTSVISVPGYQTPPVRQWGLRNELETAARAVDTLSRLHIYIHRPVFDEEDVFSWEKFLEAGNDLAEDVARLSTQFPERPIIFIAHSLGGVLLKKALLLTHQNIHDKRFKLVVDCLSGILFLGTPHCGTNDDDTLLRHNRVLHNCAKFAMQRRSSRLPAKDVFQLANLAATFQQIATIPMLSVYETDYQRTGVHWPFKGKKKVLVDKETATISAQIEHFLGVHLSHMELCNLSKLRDQTYSAREFLCSLLEDISTSRRPSDQPSSSGYDPLNPLNLADIEPPERSRGASLHGDMRTIGSSSESIRTSQRLPRRLRHVPSNSDRLLQSRQCQLPCYSLASYSRNPEFIGRTEVFSRVDQYLLPRPTRTDTGEAQNSRVFSLCGMGGVGKTDLAIEYAYTRLDAFGAVFWLEAGGVSQLISDFAGISIKLGLESPEEAQDLESSRAIVKAWLNNPFKTPNRTGDPSQTNYSWLLIFDNADTLDIIADYIPYYGNGSILITSRDPFAKTHFFSNGQGIDLEPLPTGDAAHLLRRLTKGTDETPGREEHQASVKVATQFDGLPLAMTQMAGFIRRRHLTISEYVELYASDARYAEVRHVGNPMQDNRYGHTLATAYSFEGLGNHSTRLLQSLAFMNPDRVQEDIYLGARGLGGPEDGGDDGEGRVWTAQDFESARYELLGSSIIKRNIDKKELWIHRVIQAEVRARMDNRTRYETFRQVLALLTKAWPPGDLCSQASERWAICEKLFPHLERFYQIYNEHVTDWETFDVDPIFPTLLNEAAVYLHERGFSHEGKMYLQLALDLCERANITNEPLISDMHLTMGALCNETNDAEGCLEHNILCLALRKAESARKKTPDLRLAFAHSQMGIAYMMIRKFALATEYFKQCVEMLKGLDVDVDEFGFPSCNLGLAYWVQGQYETADGVLTDLLQQREERHGKFDRVSYKTGRVLQALGNVKASRAKQLEGRGKEAEAKILWDEVFYLHSECLKQYEATLGLFNHRTADACHKLAEYHIRFGQDDLAQEYLDRALSIWGDRQWFRNESARSSFLRGTHLQSMGGKQNVEEGKRLVERAVALRRQILPGRAGKKDLEMEDFDDLVCFWSI